MVTEQEKTLSSQSRRRIAVIGAGVSGLAAAKCLLEEGLEPMIYEQAPQIGGLWNYDEALPDGGGVMYRSLRTNTSKHTMAFSDFPLPETAPDFLPHIEVLQYLRDYAAHFGLHTYIHLNTIVKSVEPIAQGQWTVCTRSPERISTFPVVGIQGRWVARVLAGSIHLPSREEMHAAIERYHLHPSHRSPVPMQVQLLEYVEDIAEFLGMRPHIWRHPGAAPRWFLGPFSAAHYRLDEPVKKP